MASSFGQQLKKFRQELNLTQAEFAERLCIDPSRISRIEHGEEPSKRVLEQLKKVFGVNAYAWLDSSGTMNDVEPVEDGSNESSATQVSEEETV